MPVFCASSFVVVCRYYADIIVGLLQDVALQAAIHPYVEPDALQLDVPPPMYDNNLETATKCLRGDLLQQRVYQSVVSPACSQTCQKIVLVLYHMMCCCRAIEFYSRAIQCYACSALQIVVLAKT